MKKGLCYLVFVIDRSGSMLTIKNDMIGGFNSFIEEQRKNNSGECRVFAYKFDTKYDVIFEDKDIMDVPALTDKNYITRGNTALYDSLGLTVDNIGKLLAGTPEDERPEKVLVITITDGEHNSNLEDLKEHYTSEKVKEMVTHQTNVYHWDFAYIGANQDAWAIGGSMGVGNNFNYKATSAGTAYALSNLSKSTSKYRSAVQTRGSAAAFNFVDPEQDKTTAPSVK
jgi:hypothetical protein